MAVVRVGCCGFPVSMKKYFRAFGVVEVQKTFYGFPSLDTLSKWKELAPDDFEFVVKASQFFTHPPTSPTYRRLGRPLTDEERRSVGFFRLNDVTKRAWSLTLNVVRALSSTKVLFQAPPSFGYSPENVDNLCEFFDYIRGSVPVVLLELRGKGWDEDALRDLFGRIGAFHVVDPTTSARPVTEGLYYFRIHGGKDYKHIYSDEELRDLASYVLSLSGNVYVMFNNVGMFEDAQRFNLLVAT